LRDWPRALVLGRRVLDGKTPVTETAKAWGRLYPAALLAGDPLEATALELSYLGAVSDDMAPALLELRFMLVDALVAAERAGEAGRLYLGAIDLAGRIGGSAQLDRSIAAASNNLGWELYEMPARSADEDTLMQLAADMSLKYWRKCGNWINEERGLYLNARVANVTGQPQMALTLADEALAIIAANGARPLDAALLHLVRSWALAELGDNGRAGRAIAEADAAPAKLTAPDLKQQFAAERARTVTALR
jgi:hypothetical protein